MPGREIHVPAVSGLPGQHVVRAPGPRRARELERDHVALPAQRADEFVQRERASLAAGARGQARAVDECRVRYSAKALAQLVQLEI